MTCDRCEAYERQLAHAHTLYTGQDESIEELAGKVRAAFASNFYAYTTLVFDHTAAAAALSELVVRAHGHVPAEAFAAAMTALEQAEKERDEAREAHDVALDEIRMEVIGEQTDRLQAEADRDRLAAALKRAKQIAAEQQKAIDDGDDDGEHVGLVRHRRAVYTGMMAMLAVFEKNSDTPVAREALNPGDAA